MGANTSLWLCLYFYGLPLDRLALNDNLVAIAEKQRIAFVSDAARGAGIVPDMRVATAYALCPDIQILQRDTEAETETLKQLSRWAYQFTPTVMPYKDFCLLLSIGGSLNLFKGLHSLRGEVKRDLRCKNFRYQEGLAHTPKAAWLFSHYYHDKLHHDQLAQSPDTVEQSMAPERQLPDLSPPPRDYWLQQLKPIPLAYLDLSVKKKQQLFNLGLRTINELLALPTKELGKRFGQELLTLLEAITGEAPSVTNDLQPAHHFSAQLDFANGITNIDELHKPLEQLLGQLLRFLTQHQLYIQQLQWQLLYYKFPGETLVIHTSAANNHLTSLLNLSKIKLESITLKAPLETIVLSSETFMQATASSGELFPELSHPNTQLRDYRQLLDKLLTRLGEQGLYSVQVGDEHLPEYQQQCSSITPQGVAALQLSQNPVSIKQQHPLPLWLNQNPVAIAEPDKIPSPLRLVYGPQRVDSHWWQSRGQRDYFIARHKNGSYCWVFRELKNERWFLHGFFG